MNNELAMSADIATGSFDSYLATIGNIASLSHEQEYALAVQYRDHGDLDAARKLVMSNLRFVAYIARGYSGYGLPLADVMQEGSVGLMKAVKRFDPEVGVRLVSFAVHLIKAEIHEYVIKNWRIVKVATTKAQRKLFFNLRKSKKDLNWLSPNDAQVIAENLQVDLKTVYEMEQRLDSRDTAYDRTTSGNFEQSYAPADYLHQDGADPATLLENNNWQQHRAKLLKQSLHTLDERSQDILSSRWLSEQKSTLHELAARYNVSAERIRQLEQKALQKIKNLVIGEV